MPSKSKSPQAPSTKSHSFLRKSTDESPSKTTSPSVPSEVRTSQFTNSLSPRCNESNHPEDDDVISDDEKTPEEIAAAELRANRRRGYDPNSSLDENNTSFLSGVGSFVSSTPSYILSHINRVYLNIPKLACCTTQLLAIMDLYVHLNVSRI